MSTETLYSFAMSDTLPRPLSAESNRSPSSSSPRPLSTPTAASYPPSKAQKERELALIPPPDRGRAAYLFLTGAFAIETVIWGLPASYGLFLDYYQQHGVAGVRSGSNLLPLVGTVSSGFIYVLGPPVSILLNPRPRWRLPVIRLGCCLCPLSLLFSSFAKAGLLYSVGGAMAYYSTFRFLSDWFVERRGFANGVCFAGTAAGGLVLPFILEALLSRYGAERTLQALAVATFVLLGSALPLIRPRLPLPPKGQVQRGKKEDGSAEAEEEASTSQPDAVVPAAAAPQPVTFRRMASNTRLLVFLAANVLQGFGYFVTLLYLPTFATSLGLPGSKSSAVLACVNGACVISRVALGVMSDKQSPHRLGFFAMAASAVAVSILWGVASTTFAPLIVFALVMGLCSGGWTSLYSAIIKSLVADDPSLASHLFSTFSFTRGLGALLCAPIASALISHPFTSASDKTAYGVSDGKYGGVVLFAGLAMGVGAGLEAVEWVLSPPKRVA
ncbi:MFS general substrate transporter [Rhodotorula sp. JG-1b]|nr:MFS general substrate transporter [Rhodotorula sp. JG-1b]